MNISVGVFAYNEEENIFQILQALLHQKTQEITIAEIIIVASGCTDNTVDIVQKVAHKDARVQVFVQNQREGKWSAINLFLQHAVCDIVVIESADTIPEDHAVEYLVKPLQDDFVGMCGAHPIPTNNKNSFIGFAVHMLWELHHVISLKNPKMGEMVAFKKVIHSIPAIAVDEAYIEAIVKQQGYRIVYAPKAIVYNRGPGTVREFLAQRRRIHVGHIQLKKKTGHVVSTKNVLSTFAAFRKVSRKDFRFFIYTPFVIVLEGISTLLGFWDHYVKKRNHVIWSAIRTTKKVK